MGRLACRLQRDTSAIISTGLESGHLIWMRLCSGDIMRLRTRKAMLEGLILDTFRRLHLALPAFWLRQITTLHCLWTRQRLKAYIHTASKTDSEYTINVILWKASDFCHCSMALTFSAIGTRHSCSCHYARAQAKPFNKPPLAIDGHSRPKMRPCSSRAPDASAASAASVWLTITRKITSDGHGREIRGSHRMGAYRH